MLPKIRRNSFCVKSKLSFTQKAALLFGEHFIFEFPVKWQQWNVNMTINDNRLTANSDIDRLIEI